MNAPYEEVGSNVQPTPEANVLVRLWGVVRRAWQGLTTVEPAVVMDIDGDTPTALAGRGPQPPASAAASRIAQLWSTGGAVSAQVGPPKTKAGKPVFVSADFVVVEIDLSVLPLTVVLKAPFTQRYCTVAAFPAPGADGDRRHGVCLLAFEMPAVEKDKARYALLQAGIATRYAGALRPTGVHQTYASEGATKTQVLGGQLDDGVVSDLVKLGKEAKAIDSAPDAMRRSSVQLELNTVVRLVHGEELTLGELPPEMAETEEMTVFCPVHVDVRPTVYSYRLEDGRPALACGHCMRTFTIRDAGNDYDFGQFERTFHELAEVEANEREAASLPTGSRLQFEIRNERYLKDLPLAPGLLLVKSPKGSGKTECLERIVRQCKLAEQHVLLIGHRRSLLLAMARRLRLWCYLVPADHRETVATTKWQRMVQKGHGLAPESESDANERRRDKLANELLDLTCADVGDSAGLRYGEPRHYYAISLDSLTMLDPKRDLYDVVLIDESEQVFGHLVGKTLQGKRQEVFLRLKHYLRVAKTVILLDADLGMVTMDALFSMGLKPDVPMSFILNNYRQDSGTVLHYPSAAQLVERLQEAVLAGEKCYVATNAKNKAIELEQVLTQAHPDRHIVAIHSDNSSSANVQALLKDIAYEFERNIDVLIASPALGTGIDITFKDAQGAGRTVVDHVFGLFRSNINTHLDMDQQLMRVRQPGQVHVWVDPIEQHFETDIGIIQDQLRRTEFEARRLLGFEDDGSPIVAPEDGLLAIWARAQAANRGSKNRAAALFDDLRRATGWKAKVVATDPEEVEAGATTLKKGRELRLEDREKKLMAARELDAMAAAALQKRDRAGLQLSELDRAALERYRIEYFYSETVSPELIEFDADGRMRTAVRNLEILLAPDEVNEKADKFRREDDVWVGDRSVRVVKAKLLRDVLGAAGVYDLKARQLRDDAVISQDTLGLFLEALRKNDGQFQSVFDFKVRKDADFKRVMQLGFVLNLVGLKVNLAKASDTGGDKERIYCLVPERLARLREVMTQRAEARGAAERSKEAWKQLMAKRLESDGQP